MISMVMIAFQGACSIQLEPEQNINEAAGHQTDERSAQNDGSGTQHHQQLIAVVADVCAVLILDDLKEAGNAGGQQHHGDDDGEKAGGRLCLPEAVILQAYDDEYQRYDSGGRE